VAAAIDTLHTAALTFGADARVLFAGISDEFRY